MAADAAGSTGERADRLESPPESIRHRHGCIVAKIDALRQRCGSLQCAGRREMFVGAMTDASHRALVLLRVPRGAAPPDDARIVQALRDDRRQLGLGEAQNGAGHRVAGPYSIEVGGQALDEYVAWEV